MESEERDDISEGNEPRAHDERDLYPSEMDVQFAFGLIVALMMVFVAGFVMLMVAIAGRLG